MVLPLASVLLPTASLSFATFETAAPWLPWAPVSLTSSRALAALGEGVGVADSVALGLGSGEGEADTSPSGTTAATAATNERTSPRTEAEATLAMARMQHTMATTIKSRRMSNLRLGRRVH